MQIIFAFSTFYAVNISRIMYVYLCGVVLLHKV